MADSKEKIQEMQKIISEAQENASMPETQKDSNTSIMFDELKLYFREPFVVNKFITIYQPTVGDIVSRGETSVYASINPFVTNPTTYRLELWEQGDDWNKISDYDFFLAMRKSLTAKETQLVFGGYDFSVLHYAKRIEDEAIVLANDDGEIVIDEQIYTVMCKYIRTMFSQSPKVERIKGKYAKEAVIEDEKKKRALRKKTAGESVLMPLVSAMINHPGFKYDVNTLKDIGIYAFMDSVRRIQVYESSRALMSGMYSGMLDTSKIDTKTELNWLRDLQDV